MPEVIAGVLSALIVVAAIVAHRDRRKKLRYVYGSVFRPADGHTRRPVRLDTWTGRVEFVLWRAGEQGHSEDYWHVMGEGWEQFFVPDHRGEP